MKSGASTESSHDRTRLEDERERTRIYDKAQIAFTQEVAEQHLTQTEYNRIWQGIYDSTARMNEEQKGFTDMLIRAAIGVAPKVKVSAKDAEVSTTVFTHVREAVEKYWEHIQPIQDKFLDPKNGLVDGIAGMLKQRTTGVFRKREGAVVFRETANINMIKGHILTAYGTLSAASAPAVVFTPPSYASYAPASSHGVATEPYLEQVTFPIDRSREGPRVEVRRNRVIINPNPTTGVQAGVVVHTPPAAGIGTRHGM